MPFLPTVALAKVGLVHFVVKKDFFNSPKNPHSKVKIGKERVSTRNTVEI